MTRPKAGNAQRPDYSGLHIINSTMSDHSLVGADFTGGTAVGVDFRGADLRGARFTRANVQADFRKARLAGSTMDAEELMGSDFRGADCRRCDFGEADMSIVKLKDCDLRGADLSRTVGVSRREFRKAVTDASTLPPVHWAEDASKSSVTAWADDFSGRLGLSELSGPKAG